MLGYVQQRLSSVWHTGLSGGAPDSVRCARLNFGELPALGRSLATIGYNSPDCPVCTGLSGEPTVGWANGRPRNLRVTRGRANGHMGAPDCPVCTGQCPVRQRLQDCNGRLLYLWKEIRHRTVSGGAPDCPVRHPTEGKICLPGLLPTAPRPLVPIKGTLGASSNIEVQPTSVDITRINSHSPSCV
jgi:hypothetical protein